MEEKEIEEQKERQKLKAKLKEHPLLHNTYKLFIHLTYKRK